MPTDMWAKVSPLERGWGGRRNRPPAPTSPSTPTTVTTGRSDTARRVPARLGRSRASRGALTAPHPRGATLQRDRGARARATAHSRWLCERRRAAVNRAEACRARDRRRRPFARARLSSVGARAGRCSARTGRPSGRWRGGCAVPLKRGTRAGVLTQPGGASLLRGGRPESKGPQAWTTWQNSVRSFRATTSSSSRSILSAYFFSTLCGVARPRRPLRRTAWVSPMRLAPRMSTWVMRGSGASARPRLRTARSQRRATCRARLATF